MASAYGARSTPASVTSAVTSSAGVTSNAGFQTAPVARTSAPGRSSISMSAPLGVPASSVEHGPTT